MAFDDRSEQCKRTPSSRAEQCTGRQTQDSSSSSSRAASGLLLGVVAQQHVADGLHVRVVRPQGSLLDDKRALQQRPPQVVVPLHARASMHVTTTQHGDQKQVQRPTSSGTAAGSLISILACSPAGSFSQRLHARQHRRAARPEQLVKSKRKISQAHVRPQGQHAGRARACSRCSTARSVSVCATSGWPRPCAAS